MTARKQAVIGLTGPMCAGKNQAAEILEQRGFLVVDADQTARRAMDAVEKDVLAAFGTEAAEKDILLTTKEGKIDRRQLGKLLFGNQQLLARHEAIIYPEIDRLLNEYIDSNTDKTVVINAPLLYKSNVLARCVFVIYIDAPFIIRFLRASKRDTLPPSQIIDRFRAQNNLYAQYISRNVDILKVSNSGTLRVLKRRLEKQLESRGY